MTDRILRGRNFNGDLGFWISKLGIDVKYADKMGMAFSSDLINPRVVVQGQTSITPAKGYRVKDNNVNGGEEKQTTIPFGRTISPMPASFAIARAASWTTPLLIGGTILTNLNNKWHSYIYENFATSSPLIADTTYGTGITHWIVGTTGGSNDVSPNWRACAFYLQTTTTGLIIHSNHSVSLDVKYLVLEY